MVAVGEFKGAQEFPGGGEFVLLVELALDGLELEHSELDCLDVLMVHVLNVFFVVVELLNDLSLGKT